MYKRFLLLAILSTSGACGSKGDKAGSAPITAPMVSGSDKLGMAFSANNIDSSLGVARVYYYEFGKGSVRELSGTEAQSPALFAADSRVFVFNRTESQRNVRVLDAATLADGASAWPEPIDLPGLTANDPWDLGVLASGKTALLAGASGGKLQILDYASGTLTDVPATGLSVPSLRPTGLFRSGARMYVLHSGLDAAQQDDGTQRIFTMTVSATGEIAFSDQNPASPAVDGLPIAPSNPAAFVNETSGSALVVGFCSKTSPGCDAGTDVFSASSTNGTAQALPLPDAATKYYAFNRIVDGPTPTSFYAHVQTEAGEYKVVKIDLNAKTAVDVHVFDDDRLYGIAYDKSSDTLFVGDHDGLKGSLTLYRGDAKVGSVELDGVPFSAAFAAK